MLSKIEIARFIAHMLAYSNIPNVSTIAKRCKADTTFKKTVGQKSAELDVYWLADILRQEYESIDKAVWPDLESTDNILELGCGFNPRGWNLPLGFNGQYIETDSRQIITQKKKALAEQLGPKYWHLVATDYSNPYTFNAVEKVLTPGNLTVIWQNLLNLKTKDEQIAAATNIVTLIRKTNRGGKIITTDPISRKMRRMLTEVCPALQKEMAPGIAEMLEMIFEYRLEDSQALQIFTDLGVKKIEVIQQIAMPPTKMPIHLDINLESPKKVDAFLAQAKIWIITV